MREEKTEKNIGEKDPTKQKAIITRVKVPLIFHSWKHKKHVQPSAINSVIKRFESQTLFLGLVDSDELIIPELPIDLPKGENSDIFENIPSIYEVLLKLYKERERRKMNSFPLHTALHNSCPEYTVKREKMAQN